jgi:MFS family permease
MNARACSAHTAAKRAPAENGQAPTTDAGSRSAFTRTLRAHDWLNFFLADVQTGVGPFLAIYLAGRQWDEERVGLALTVGGIAGVVAQTPAGALVDLLSSKRGLVASMWSRWPLGARLIALFPSFWPVMAAQVLVGGTSSIFMPAICAGSLGLVGHQAFDARQGRNQTFNSADNVTAAMLMGLIGYAICQCLRPSAS